MRKIVTQEQADLINEALKLPKSTAVDVIYNAMDFDLVTVARIVEGKLEFVVPPEYSVGDLVIKASGDPSIMRVTQISPFRVTNYACDGYREEPRGGTVDPTLYKLYVKAENVIQN
jgi:hypothetical protein